MNGQRGIRYWMKITKPAFLKRAQYTNGNHLSDGEELRGESEVELPVNLSLLTNQRQSQQMMGNLLPRSCVAAAILSI